MNKRSELVHHSFSDLSSEALQGRRMEGGFTLVELLVVISIIALLMAVLVPALSRAREQGKRAACLYYQRQMVSSWMMYADDNGDKIVNGDAEEYGQWGDSPCTAPAGSYVSGGIHYRERPWVMRDWGTPPCWVGVFGLSEKREQIKKGALYRYVKDVKVYRCPRANADETRSFSVVDQINVTVIGTAVLNDTSVMLIKTRMDIKKAYERMIFVDDGGCEGKTEGGWTVTFQTPPQWWDPPSARHGDGTTFSFVDGHAEYHKWLEHSTLDCAKTALAGCLITPTTATRDIRWAQVAAWGSATASKLNP